MVLTPVAVPTKEDDRGLLAYLRETSCDSRLEKFKCQEEEIDKHDMIPVAYIKQLSAQTLL